MDAEAVEVQGVALRRDLHEALVVGAVEEADGGAALFDARGLVVGRPSHVAAVTGDLVAVGVIAELVVMVPPLTPVTACGLRRAGRRIVVGADVGLGEDIADRVVGEGLGLVAR